MQTPAFTAPAHSIAALYDSQATRAEVHFQAEQQRAVERERAAAGRFAEEEAAAALEEHRPLPRVRSISASLSNSAHGAGSPLQRRMR